MRERRANIRVKPSGAIMHSRYFVDIYKYRIKVQRKIFICVSSEVYFQLHIFIASSIASMHTSISGIACMCSGILSISCIYDCLRIVHDVPNDDDKSLSRVMRSHSIACNVSPYCYAAIGVRSEKRSSILRARKSSFAPTQRRLYRFSCWSGVLQTEMWHNVI